MSASLSSSTSIPSPQASFDTSPSPGGSSLSTGALYAIIGAAVVAIVALVILLPRFLARQSLQRKRLASILSLIPRNIASSAGSHDIRASSTSVQDTRASSASNPGARVSNHGAVQIPIQSPVPSSTYPVSSRSSTPQPKSIDHARTKSDGVSVTMYTTTPEIPQSSLPGFMSPRAASSRIDLEMGSANPSPNSSPIIRPQKSVASIPGPGFSVLDPELIAKGQAAFRNGKQSKSSPSQQFSVPKM
ncbi:uncharacterized protein BJ171DRAFT_580915 [Polychytrium aggregatum]|uniref:uncharacterized protein n=1 Tax=Polychytrium aggregatum TaxID=110093 RepID=UPI0022FE831E|nr:uncharacterized protein BJ171DRAFT_580915 [Polychytrium aggregatum]KAI9205229.1 hypothetical protein BJ171DRAFT_580915 [Polychytrium aggregatum]